MREGETPAPSSRFFARVRSLDIACPRCDYVYSITRAGHKCWNSRLSRFHCRQCGLVLAIGVVAYSVAGGGSSRPPQDQVPTPREALELRKDGVWLVAERGRVGRGGREGLNRLIGEGEEEV